ncbi:YdcH family protein [Budviciaceae bacterium BWR-B9]|uniref:YdcH family protein n=1 Tax=Limnobaculum allomyrinae TaxID=2791986 RepID=A0ABS1IU54_9GAMM|nr:MULTISPECIES: YdcH family protein [Limnobaculum]MBK5145288.1 YdcH family protein [Limnobaculum allomyrinae]MBV7693284.1 YdcH family protein [Limnobaculum sp. M2-1]
MFPEYRDLITQLKTTHPRFHSLFDKHNDLDHEILRLQAQGGNSLNDKIATLKKEKLRLKDELYRILREESQARA